MKNFIKFIFFIIVIFITGCKSGNYYVVTFVDETGQIISTENVREGQPAESPIVDNIPEGYIISWSQKFDCITDNLIVIGRLISNAQKYTVTFKDIEGNILKTEIVNKNESAVGLTLPNKNGYIFKGWNKDFSNITSDLELFPLYEENAKLYRIEFDGMGGSIENTNEIQYVEEGKMPIIPKFYKEMHEFIGFNKDVEAAKADCKYYAQYKELTIEKIPSIDLIKRITFGWNYVNGINEDNDVDKIIDLILEKNINTIQLPIKWIKYSDETYAINEDILNKTKSIVDKAVSKGMYVVIGSYDDYAYQWSSLNYDNFNKLINVMNVQWTQIGEIFKEYDEHVIFSFLGEPRDYSDNRLDKEAFHILNDLNQMFVDLIRNQGGNNLYRHLIITTGWSRISDASYKYFKMIDDDYVIVGVHSYTPFGFTHNDTLDEVNWSSRIEEYQIEILNEMQNAYDNFLKNNIAVIMTEFGSRDKQNDKERAKWMEFYVSCAYAYGIKCFTWDSAKLHFERDYTFALINRETYEWAFPALTDKLSDMFVENNYISFYLEARNQIQKISDEIIIPSYVTNLITKEVEICEAIYDPNLFNIIDGKLYAKQSGAIVIGLKVNGYVYYFQIEVYPDYKLIDTQFTLRVDNNESGDTQCFIETLGYSTMRVDYNWYSTDESILIISKYSTITIKKDGVVGIIAINKETNDIGVVEVVIKNYTIISYNSEIQNINE